MAAATNIKVGDAMRQVTLEFRIVGAGVARVRLWLAAQIIRLAGLVAGCNIKIETGGELDEVSPSCRTYEKVGGLVVPRQASVREGSPYYVSNFHEWGPRVDILLDGERQQEVVSFDADAGFVRVHRLNEDGTAFIAGDEIATEVKRGRVEIVPLMAA